jgi:hypothetical protein
MASSSVFHSIFYLVTGFLMLVSSFVITVFIFYQIPNVLLQKINAPKKLKEEVPLIVASLAGIFWTFFMFNQGMIRYFF